MADPVTKIERISTREVRIEHQSGYTQYAIRYDDGRIAYDRPEIISQRSKSAVAKHCRNHHYHRKEP